MNWTRDEDPRQMELTERLEAPLTNAERQRNFRARQKLLKRKPRTVYMTDDEAFYVERMLIQMRENETQRPAAMRCTATGRYVHLDV